MRIFIILLFTIFTLGTNCQTTAVNYTYDNTDFVNPERGFYRYTITYGSAYDTLVKSTLVGWRNQHQPFSANYQIYSSLVFRYFVLDNFKTSAISAAFLQNLQRDFNTCRNAGVKLIIRFTYTDIAPSGSCGSWICPPYGDATKARVLGHIAQLKPYFQANKDVIATVQMGFIGVWGEQYYTDYFGDASQAPYTLSNTNWNDRRQVLDSLLAAVPADIGVQVRYPQKKQKDIYGNAAPTNSAPLTLSEAFTGSTKSRIGFHNDCFLANFDDYGTYANYSTGNSDTTNLKPYKASDSKYVMVGGETCDSTGIWGLCDNLGGKAIQNLSRMHYTYLNADYNNTKVNNHWTTNNCMSDIRIKLGYRLYLNNGSYSTSVNPGGTFTYTINLTNNGYASPVNKRKVILYLVHNTTNVEYKVMLPHNPQLWFTGTHTISGSVCIPSCVPSGNYKLYLRLADPSVNLETRPEYSVRLANTGIWVAAKGYNDLNHTVVVGATTGTCSAGLAFVKTENKNEWIGPNIGNWNSSISNWSLNHIPLPCEDVVIGANKVVTIPVGYIAYAKNVEVNTAGSIKILGILETE